MKRRRVTMGRYIAIALSVMMALTLLAPSIYANEGAPSYNYSYWGEAVAAPLAYTATQTINGHQLGVGPLREPNDFHMSPDQRLHILDSGNDRVIIINEQMEVTGIIDSFMNGSERDAFNKPQGVFVSGDNHVYVADTGNRRVVHLDDELRLVKIVDSPESELLKTAFEFNPVRLVVDRAQRIYVMSSGVFDGFMEFNADGEFVTFIGANRVSIDPIEYFWKLISTREQRSQMVMFTPTEFTSLDINDEGFIYAVNRDQGGDPIKKLNAQGTDILRSEGYATPRGDLLYWHEEGPSTLTDISVGDSEIYSVLDTRRGRIFTYNGDGHLMYVFGGIGNRLGQFMTPVAIEAFGDRLLVLDRTLGELTVFQTTEYGRLLNEAVRSYYRGEEEKAFVYYSQVINLNANLDFAYTGIGKALLRQGKYAEAMAHFELGMDKPNYSKAYVLYRKEVLREYFAFGATSAIVLVLFIMIWRRFRKKRGGNQGVSIEQTTV